MNPIKLKEIENISIKSPNHSIDIEWNIRTCPEENNTHETNNEKKTWKIPKVYDIENVS